MDLSSSSPSNPCFFTCDDREPTDMPWCTVDGACCHEISPATARTCLTRPCQPRSSWRSICHVRFMSRLLADLASAHLSAAISMSIYSSLARQSCRELAAAYLLCNVADCRLLDTNQPRDARYVGKSGTNDAILVIYTQHFVRGCSASDCLANQSRIGLKADLFNWYRTSSSLASFLSKLRLMHQNS